MRTFILFFVFAIFFSFSNSFAEQSQYVDEQGWNTVSSAGFVFKWKINKDEIDCRVEAATKGWIAVGFNNVNRMNNANIIIGCVDKKGVKVEDHFGKGHGHHKDKIQNVKNIFGKESIGKTEIYFTIPLDSKDPEDFVLEEKRPVFVIMAVGSKDSFSTIHSKKTSVKIIL